MANNSSSSWGTELRKVLWPIEWHENKKFLPMAAMMFFILFNYSTLRSIKDGFVVSQIGPEAISFLKTYFVLPSAILAMVIYAELCNLMSAEKVFYSITLFFVGYLALFAFFLYPYPEMFHMQPETVERLASEYPYFQWFIRIIGQWSYATFYIMAELWGSMMLSLLFWQFANQITKTEEAKRFYSMFGLLGNLGLILTGFVLDFFLHEDAPHYFGLKFTPILVLSALSGVCLVVIYAWMQKNVLTDPTLYQPGAGKSKKSKAKLSLKESFRLIFSSKYLGLIAILVLAYGISINLVEGVWKAKIRELYPTAEAYTRYMGFFQGLQGAAAIFFMLVGSNILRRVSWGTAAIFTPLMVLITGLGFFGFIFFGDVLDSYLGAILVMQPLALAVTIGTIQNVLSKATKYSLFDSTKEMAYIPLDDELKTKGKAAVDVVGGRMGKSGGGLIQSTFFMLIPSLTFTEAMPYFAAIFFLIVLAWVYAVKALNKEYNSLISETESK
ncbi:MAG: tlc1 [Rickettsiaceae bacterium]|jgi:AAA family ATP:ADP antiporter|nr:tlc1 [Rickettsiaceae bacterium]